MKKKKLMKKKKVEKMIIFCLYFQSIKLEKYEVKFLGTYGGK